MAETPPAGLFEASLVLPDGLGRRLMRWGPQRDARGRVLMLHGFGNHAAVFEHAAGVLTAAGYACLAYDQRGFGADRVRGKWPGTDQLLADAVAVARGLDEERSALPTFLMGESLGASLWAIAASRDLVRPAGLVMSGPACSEATPHRVRDRMIVTALSWVIPRRGLTVEPETGHLAPEAAAFFRSDPHIVRYASVSDYAGILTIADEASTAVGKLPCPVWFGYGTADEIIPLASFEAAAGHLPSGATVQPYEDGPHALLHWQARETVLEDIRTWLDSQTVSKARPA